MASSDEKPSLLILGNSYANHFYPGVVANKRLKHHSVLSIGACDAAGVDESSTFGEAGFSPCSGSRPIDQQKLIHRIVVEERSIKYALIGGLPHDPTPEYMERLRRRIDFLEGNGVRVVVFTPHVRIPYNIKGCYTRPLARAERDCKIPASEHRNLKSSFQPLVDSLKSTNPRVLFFDQNILFCDDVVCSFKLPVMPAFRDEFAHLSEFASLLLFDEFVEWAEWVA
jgi:hypothetical protein